MGEGKKIVTERFPAEKLPEEVRAGIESGEWVRVTVEQQRNESVRPLASFVGTARGVYQTPEDVVASINAIRDEWK
jgi:hypothetical protein